MIFIQFYNIIIALNHKSRVFFLKIEVFCFHMFSIIPPKANTTETVKTFQNSKTNMSSRTFSAQQQAKFAKNSDPAQGVSLCIPRVFNNISWKRIKGHIIDANLGFVERVDVVPVAGKNFKRAFVHFAPGKWNMRDATARQALKALQEGNKIKLTYEDPWFWLVGISGAARPAEAPKPKQRKTQIDLSPKKVSVPKKLSAPKLTRQRNAEYDLSAQQDEELAPTKLSRQSNEVNLNNPIVARAMSNSPTTKASDEQLEEYSHLSEQAAAFMVREETAEDN